ncbi:molybdopterin cofactor-binding domain-containing protein [Aromatoleum evansii]|uniref:molybdopterin cofactor-binding domain-containing protein n=1 Tax=Aromatoleum evansii TaxID=59406 RepID=UPI002483C28D|nr:molybdopterin cofactor-binding domain-containing protein [Aromatoleum evansii]
MGEDPYRGYGPPPHNLVLESLMDVAARELALAPAELRRRNYIRPEQFPYTVPSGNEYDIGNYAAVLDRVLELAEYRALRASQAQSRAEGRLVGIGVVGTVEPGVFDWNAYATVGVPEGVKATSVSRRCRSWAWTMSRSGSTSRTSSRSA